MKPHDLASLVVPALAVCLLAFFPCQARARELSGNVFLHDGLKLVMELKEGFFSELFRTIGLRSKPRPRVDLTSLGNGGDRLFVGTDLGLYCEKAGDSANKSDLVFKIGNCIELWNISLARNVKLSEVQQVTGAFEGDTGKRLSVDVAQAPKKAPDVEKAGFKFWLDEIVYQYDNPLRRKGKMDNFTVLTRCILDALPESPDDPQEKYDNFNALIRFVREAKDSSLAPFRAVLRQKIARVKERQGKGQPPGEKEASLFKGYERLQAEVDRRSEEL